MYFRKNSRIITYYNHLFMLVLFLTQSSEILQLHTHNIGYVTLKQIENLKLVESKVNHNSMRIGYL